MGSESPPTHVACFCTDSTKIFSEMNCQHPGFEQTRERPKWSLLTGWAAWPQSDPKGGEGSGGHYAIPGSLVFKDLLSGQKIFLRSLIAMETIHSQEASGTFHWKRMPWQGHSWALVLCLLHQAGKIQGGLERIGLFHFVPKQDLP